MTSSEASSSEADSSEANGIQRQTHQKQMVSRSKDSSDTKKRCQRQCTKSTTTMPTFVPATTNSAQCLLYTTRITVTKAETFPYMMEWI